MTLSRILRTKAIPPPRNARTLVRPRVNEMLAMAKAPRWQNCQRRFTP